jgi:predicted nicotinamide N-methyase
LSLSPGDRRAFILANTALGTAEVTPEIRLYLASKLTPLWQSTEQLFETQNIAPPFWTIPNWFAAAACWISPPVAAWPALPAPWQVPLR